MQSLLCGLRSILVVSGMTLVALVQPIVASPAQANECQAQCEDRYYQCNMGGAWVAEKTCATQRSTCYAACSPQKHGAVAYSKKTRTYGYTTGLASREIAEKTALTECAATEGSPTDCTVLIWFYNRCGAIALGDNGSYGAAHHATQAGAAKEALQHCAPYGGSSCSIVREICSR